MGMNEAETRYHLIDPVLREKGYVSRDHITLETSQTPAPVEPSGAKGRRRKGQGRTDYLLCVQVGDMPKALPVAVLEAKKKPKTRSKACSRPRAMPTVPGSSEVRLLDQRPPIRRVRFGHQPARRPVSICRLSVALQPDRPLRPRRGT